MKAVLGDDHAHREGAAGQTLAIGAVARVDSHSSDEASILSTLATIVGLKFGLLRGIERGVDGGPK
jgi:hypothetical protein